MSDVTHASIKFATPIPRWTSTKKSENNNQTSFFKPENNSLMKVTEIWSLKQSEFKMSFKMVTESELLRGFTMSVSTQSTYRNADTSLALRSQWHCSCLKRMGIMGSCWLTIWNLYDVRSADYCNCVQCNTLLSSDLTSRSHTQVLCHSSQHRTMTHNLFLMLKSREGVGVSNTLCIGGVKS